MSAAYYPIQIISGDHFSLQFTNKLKDCESGESVPIDLSSVQTVSGAIYDRNGSLLVQFNTSVNDVTGGVFTISLNESQTSTLSGTNANKVTENIGRYNVKFIYYGGEVKTKLYGPVSVTNILGA